MKPFDQPISVLITTKNRHTALASCLCSLTKQTLAPDEVVVVDNGSTDETKTVCKTFAKILNIRYFYEPRAGIPFGRNMGLKHAKGTICAFIDDDCRAYKQWVESIDKHFKKYGRSVGVVGKTSSSSPANIYGAVEYAFYWRWVLRNVQNPKRTQRLLSGAFIDFKNAAFKRSFIVREPFSTRVPFGDVGDEDPSIQVSHLYSTTLQRLFVRNFWNGYANQVLRLQFGIDPSRASIKTHISSWFWLHPMPLRFVLLLACYPWASRMGRFYAWIRSVFRLQPTLPLR
jgi:glycosyltransferase involved in cell wall biosynthesis